MPRGFMPERPHYARISHEDVAQLTAQMAGNSDRLAIRRNEKRIP